MDHATAQPPPDRPIRLRLNGAEVEVAAPPDEKLLYVLRGDFGLKGTRYGCGAGDCGACMVLVDGVPTLACDLPLWAAAGRAVTTVEGVGARAPALIDAFLAAQAAQCGYCASGVIVSAAALLARDPHPDEAAVRAALDPHLCRCGAHNRMVRAVLAARRAPADG